MLCQVITWFCLGPKNLPWSCLASAWVSDSLASVTVRQLAEKYVEFSKELYVCYIDFRKAFNSVWQEGLWEVMRHMGYPEKIVRILDKMYEGTFSAVRAAGGLSEWFETVARLCVDATTI